MAIRGALALVFVAMNSFASAPDAPDVGTCAAEDSPLCGRHVPHAVLATAGCTPSDEDPSGLECVFRQLYAGRMTNPSPGSRAPEYTYGEIRPAAMEQLLLGDGLFGVAAGMDDVFVDLGSGTGKLPVQALLHGVRKAVGVELDEDRHSAGAKALESLASLLGVKVESDATRSGLLFDGRSLELVAGDLLALPIHHTTVAFAASLCFPDWLLEAVQEKLRKELAPGAMFWSLKELLPGKHSGLVHVGTLLVQSTWSPRTKFVLYARVPNVPLPPLGEASEEAAIGWRRSWADSVVAASLEAFSKLQTAGGGGDAGLGSMAADVFLHAALSELGVLREVTALRLLHSFGSRRLLGSEDDSCGCLLVGAAHADEVWSLSPAEFTMMLAHGAFPDGGKKRLDCLTTARACSCGDVLLEEAFGSLRERARCEEKQAKDLKRGRSRPCSTKVGEPGAKLDALAGMQCSRSSDGRSLLHASLFRDKRDLANMSLAAAGPTLLLCPDLEGSMAVHLAARFSTDSTINFLLEAVRSAGPPVISEALVRLDGTGRPPIAVARSATALGALLAAGCPAEGLEAVDAGGASPLYQAVLQQQEDVAMFLMRHGANASCTGRLDNSPLMAAARKGGQTALRLAQALVEHRADVNAAHGETSRSTALHLAAGAGHVEIVEGLLAMRADASQTAMGDLRPRDITTDAAVIALLEGADAARA